MELKEYQKATLDSFERWKKALDEASLELERLREQGIDDVHINEEILHYPHKAWRMLADSGDIAESAGDYVRRSDGAKRPIPHVCFKIPTGGGKTLLAASALERLNEKNGFVLWITPTKAIYEQTKGALKSRGHPYRQTLDRASGGRLKLLEKDNHFARTDIEHYLCIMLLMLPAVNRQKKSRDFLRIFRDSGRYPTFFPDDDDLIGDADYRIKYPDLDLSGGKLIKHSLFNVLKIVRPIVILDEAHKAYGPKRKEEFVESVNRLDPRLVIELSATPNKGISNLLVDITGLDLKKEEMIKLPITVTSFPKDAVEWAYTLAQAQEELDRLNTEAQSLQMAEGRYIRPIAVVRVERTGKEQRDGYHIHSEDVREYLVQGLGVPPEQVAVKSSELDELGRENLLSEFSQIRWIITKSALMEGWDCPFAYLLVMLDNTKTQRAITQLVGRVMRQPHARLTGREALDQCYVYCWNVDVGTAVVQVKKGLEQEGLSELSHEVISPLSETKEIKITRREFFRGQTIFLPRVLHISKEGWEDLDYERHILPAINWDAIKVVLPRSLFSTRTLRQTVKVDVDGKEPTYNERTIYVDKTIKYSWFARRLTDIVPNPWQASRLAKQLISQYSEDDIREKAYDRRSELVLVLRDQISKEIENQAQKIFNNKLKTKEIRFDLETGQPNYRLVDSYKILVNPEEPTLQKQYGSSLQLSLFEPVFIRDFDSEPEQKFARYLDEQKALQWWHKVAATQKDNYYLMGWNQARIWPDFIAMSNEIDGKICMLLYEIKGEHMRDSVDTKYKSSVLETLEEAFNYGTMTVRDGPMKGVFRMVFGEKEFPSALAELGDD